MIQSDPKDTRVVLVFIAPLALVSYGRQQGWEMHQRCLQGALSLNSEVTARLLLDQCQELR
jgi:hypothetical protein